MQQISTDPISPLGLCGYVGFWDFLTRRVRIGIAAFDDGRCCKLASTVLHEASHLRLFKGTERNAYKLEKDCFGCGTGKPPAN